MQLEEFFDYKNQLMNDLLTNEEIVRLLADDCKPVNDVQDLVYKQVFPYEYIPETIEHGQTFICCDVDIQKSVNKTFLIPVLYIWVFSHKSNLRLPKETGGGIRTDKLCSEIIREKSSRSKQKTSIGHYRPASQFPPTGKMDNADTSFTVSKRLPNK